METRQGNSSAVAGAILSVVQTRTPRSLITFCNITRNYVEDARIYSTTYSGTYQECVNWLKWNGEYSP